jgi:hypothetical protein
MVKITHRPLFWQNIALLVLIVTALSMLIAQGVWSWKFLDRQLYSYNTFSGVFVSRHTDINEVFGTKTSSNAYGDFLPSALARIGRNASSPLPVHENVFPSWYPKDKGIAQAFRVRPVLNADFFFGIQRNITFHTEDSLSPEAIGEWVKLATEDERHFHYGVVQHVEHDRVIVQTSLPWWFFPKSITLIPQDAASNQQGEASTSYIVTNNLASSVRGGFVQGAQKPTLHLFKPPWRSYGFPSPPRPGDTLRFATGETARIQGVLNLTTELLIELDEAAQQNIKPFTTVRNDVVTIVSRASQATDALGIRIADTTNAEFVNGRERFVKVALENADRLSANDLLTLEAGQRPYRVHSATKDTVVLDLVESLALETCLQEISLQEDKAQPWYELSDRYGKPNPFAGINPQRCLKEASLLDTYKKVFEQWHSTPDRLRKKILKDLTQTDLSPSLSSGFVWYRSMDVRLHAMPSRSIIETLSPPPTPDATDKKDPHIWEIYPGSFLNVLYGTRNPAPIEMLIHVLSVPERTNYYKSFEAVQPPYVVIAKPRQFTPWLVHWHWPFFEAVLHNYRPVTSNTDFALWERKSEPWRLMVQENLGGVQDDRPHTPTLTAHSLHEAPSCAVRAAQVRVRYTVHNPFIKVPVIGRSDRLFVHVENVGTGLPPRPPISLPQESGEFVFPIVYRAGSVPTLRFEQISPFHPFAKTTLHGWEITPMTEAAGVQENGITEMFLEGAPFTMLAKEKCIQKTD